MKTRKVMQSGRPRAEYFLEVKKFVDGYCQEHLELEMLSCENLEDRIKEALPSDDGEGWAVVAARPNELLEEVAPAGEDDPMGPMIAGEPSRWP